MVLDSKFLINYPRVQPEHRFRTRPDNIYCFGIFNPGIWIFSWVTKRIKSRSSFGFRYSDFGFINKKGKRPQAIKLGDRRKILSYDQDDGFGKFDLYVIFKKGQDSWTAPKNLGSRINTSANEHFPSFTQDGLYLFFVSDRILGQSGSKHPLIPETFQNMKNHPGNGSSDI